MFDDLPDEVGVIDFDEFANHLLEQGLEIGPADVHGCLSGLLAAGFPTQPEAGLAALCQALELDMHGELAGQTLQLYTVTAAALQDEEFEFYPLLPDDSVDIMARTAALAGWCRSFLAGFAHATAGVDRASEALPEDIAEILKDLAAISDAGVDDDAGEEESEASYAELVEYLRFAALNMYMDTQSGAGAALRIDPDGGEVPPLH